MRSNVRLKPPPQNTHNLKQIAFGLAIVLILPTGILAEDQPSGIEKGHGAEGEQIQIVADKLTTNSVEKYAEFVGDVKTTHPDFIMVSENLKIYYRDNLPGLKNQPSEKQMIKRIVASGKVSIKSDEYTAETDSAAYDMDTMVLVLEGENSRVQSGKNILTGSKITIYRKDEEIKVEGSPQKRVKAVFYSDATAEKQP